MRKQYGTKPCFCPKCRANVFPAPRASKSHRKRCLACNSFLLPLTAEQAKRREETEHQERVFRFRQIRKDRIRKWEDDWDELDEAAELRPGDLEI